MHRHAEIVLADGCAAVERAGADALIVDQCDLAAGSIAERLGLPFVTVSFFPPVYLDNEVPPNFVGWSPSRHECIVATQPRGFERRSRAEKYRAYFGSLLNRRH